MANRDNFAKWNVSDVTRNNTLPAPYNATATFKLKWWFLGKNTDAVQEVLKGDGTGNSTVHMLHPDVTGPNNTLEFRYELLGRPLGKFTSCTFQQRPNTGDYDGTVNFSTPAISSDGKWVTFRSRIDNWTTGRWKCLLVVQDGNEEFKIDPEITNEASDADSTDIKSILGVILLLGGGALFWLFRRRQLNKKKK